MWFSVTFSLRNRRGRNPILVPMILVPARYGNSYPHPVREKRGTFGADFPVEIDYGKDRLKAQIATVLPEGAASNRNITFDFEGKLDRSGQIVSGTLKDSSGAARAEGQGIGAFYGPYAAELNLFGKLVLADGRQLLVFFFQQP